MTIHQSGDSGDYAIMEINHKKKKVKMLDCMTRKPFQKGRADFSFLFIFPIMVLSLLMIVFSIISYYTDNWENVIVIFVLFIIFISIYTIIFHSQKNKDKLHYYEQWFFNDF